MLVWSAVPAALSHGSKPARPTSGSAAAAPARPRPPPRPAHHHSPPQRIHLRNTSVGLTTTATPGTTHWEKLLIFRYCRRQFKTCGETKPACFTLFLRHPIQVLQSVSKDLQYIETMSLYYSKGALEKGSIVCHMQLSYYSIVYEPEQL